MPLYVYDLPASLGSDGGGGGGAAASQTINRNTLRVDEDAPTATASAKRRRVGTLKTCRAQLVSLFLSQLVFLSARLPLTHSSSFSINLSPPPPHAISFSLLRALSLAHSAPPAPLCSQPPYKGTDTVNVYVHNVHCGMLFLKKKSQQMAAELQTMQATLPKLQSLALPLPLPQGVC